ncbi:hypothetical protein CPS_3403 [Colwellia psychrerythraea 34H]|uniref:Uncharacterized protein n=1 Tax=Colwellia psychrerythraea (strain 34H / ATCC BAA-681) TaxID=167879 RepID=Q47YP2_COLP3|nr:hypothetical protein CPS_3403 [Colwellia psychrerythraea 34H]
MNKQSIWYYRSYIMSGPLLAINPEGSIAVIDIYHFIDIFHLINKR